MTTPTSEFSSRASRLNDLVRRDHIWLNNPVVMQGLGLAPIVVADTTGYNALILMIMVTALLTLTRVVSVALLHITGNHFRAVIYSYVAALLYIPVYLLLNEFVASRVLSIGIYLPLLVVDPLITIRCERNKLEDLTNALRRGINTTVGACLSILILGCARELLGAGTLFGHVVLKQALLPIAGMPAGGFLLVGVFCAVWRTFANRYKAVLGMEVEKLNR